MEIRQNSKCVKIGLPNGKVVDVLSPVMDEIRKWIQDDCSKPESGGYIVGYQHEHTGNVSLEAVSHPRHQLFLKRARRHKSYYMGVWHTHPQKAPVPSEIDWNDWNETMRSDKTGCQYVFFVIAGTDEWRLWVGDLLTGKIQEACECEKDANGIYIRKNAPNEETM